MWRVVLSFLSMVNVGNVYILQLHVIVGIEYANTGTIAHPLVTDHRAHRQDFSNHYNIHPPERNISIMKTHSNTSITSPFRL